MEVYIRPKLRFSEFKESWNEILLNNIATFSKGKNISKSDITEDGSIECIRYGELYTDYNEIISNIVSKTDLPHEDLVFSLKNDIIMPSSGETQLDIATASCVLKKNVALGGDLNIIRTEEDGVFISYYLNSAKKKVIASLAQGNSVVHLYNHHLKGLKLNLPSLGEQQKIASFLSAVDKKIELLQKKKDHLEQYKKGVMQQIFSQQIRFRDDDGNDYPKWSKIKISDLPIYISDGNYGEMYPKSNQMKNSGIPFIRANNIKNLKLVWNDMRFIDASLHSLLLSGHLKRKDILVTTRGEIGMLAFVDDEFEGSNINAQICLLRCDESMNAKYLLYNLSHSDCQKQFKKLQTGSALKQLPRKNLSKLKVQLPSIAEQNKIANFLSAIDDKIELVNSQLENSEDFKKGLLQQMFV